MNPLHDLRGVDLDLLIALDVLMRTRSVTAAAAELDQTQSSMSHALRRLRDLLDDPVLVRVGNGMMPTPRAESLAMPLRAVLLDLQRVLQDSPAFDPAGAQHRFRISTPDLFDALLLPDLVARFTAAGPGLELVVRTALRGSAQALALGQLDLAIVPVVAGQAPTQSGEFVRKTLFHDGLMCFLRAGHPVLSDGLGLASFAALSHAMVSPSGQGMGPVDQALAAHGLTRHIALRLPSFAVAGGVVAGSELVLTAPASLGKLVDPDRVVMVPPPVPLPGHGIAMLWHARFGADPAHRWLRESVAEVAARSGSLRQG